MRQDCPLLYVRRPACPTVGVQLIKESSQVTTGYEIRLRFSHVLNSCTGSSAQFCINFPGYFPTSFLDHHRSSCWSEYILSSLIRAHPPLPPTEHTKFLTLAKGDYKGMVLTGASTYCAWRAILIAECKSEKLWKDLDGSATTPDQDPRDLPSTTTTTGESSTSSTVDTAKVVLCAMHTLVLNGYVHAIRS